MKTALILSALTFGLFFSASAQQTSTPVSHNVSLVLADAIELTFTSGSGAQTLNFTTADHYANGVEQTSIATLQVRSNRPYNFAVKAGADFFTLGGNPSLMPSSILGVKINGAASYTQLTTSNQNLLTNQARGTNSHTVDYQANPGFAYTGGTYVNSVVYTATQQ